MRWHTSPHRKLEADLPRRGRILEVGCGHGLLALHLALGVPERTVLGVDIDASKIEHARAAAVAAQVDDRVHFEHVAADWTPRD